MEPLSSSRGDSAGVALLGFDPLGGSKELVDNLGGGDAQDPLGVVEARFLVHLGSEGHRVVDGANPGTSAAVAARVATLEALVLHRLSLAFLPVLPSTVPAS